MDTSTVALRPPRSAARGIHRLDTRLHTSRAARMSDSRGSEMPSSCE